MKSKNADILVIGGGVIGSGIAWHLASKGCSKIIVIDKLAAPGLGSTGKATGGFRAQFATKINIQLSLLSGKKLLAFKDELDTDPGFRQAGYLFIAKNQLQMNALTELQKLQKSCGLDEVHVVLPKEIYSLNPFLTEDDNEIFGGVFSPSDGFINPLNILNGYKQGAENLGADFQYNVECKGFNIAGNKIIEAVTSVGNIKADYVVNAAGAWAGVVAKQAGADLPVLPQRREIAVLKEINLFSEDMPMTIFINDGFHFRQRDGDALLLHPEINSSLPFNINIDEEWVKKVKSAGNKRIKKVSGASIDYDKCRAGLYEVSPDKHAIVGAHPVITNLYFANGSSGHGVMHSPALGEIISELILNGRFNEFDIHPLRFSRFKENDLNPSSEYL